MVKNCTEITSEGDGLFQVLLMPYLIGSSKSRGYLALNGLLQHYLSDVIFTFLGWVRIGLKVEPGRRKSVGFFIESARQTCGPRG
jgi:hypothetical protein